MKIIMSTKSNSPMINYVDKGINSKNNNNNCKTMRKKWDVLINHQKMSKLTQLTMITAMQSTFGIQIVKQALPEATHPIPSS